MKILCTIVDTTSSIVNNFISFFFLKPESRNVMHMKHVLSYNIYKDKLHPKEKKFYQTMYFKRALNNEIIIYENYTTASIFVIYMYTAIIQKNLKS